MPTAAPVPGPASPFTWQRTLSIHQRKFLEERQIQAFPGSFEAWGKHAEKGDFLTIYPCHDAKVKFLILAFGVDAINTWPAHCGMVNRRVRRDGSKCWPFLALCYCSFCYLKCCSISLSVDCSLLPSFCSCPVSTHLQDNLN